METGFRSSCVAYSRPCRVISSESFTSLLTPSPLAMAAPTTSHIPTANAFFYRSLPCFPLATVSERSIRKRRLFPPPPHPPPRPTAVRPLLTGDDEASIGDFGCLLWFDPCGPRAVPSYCRIRACPCRQFRGGPKRLLLSHDRGAIGLGRQLKCFTSRLCFSFLLTSSPLPDMAPPHSPLLYWLTTSH